MYPLGATFDRSCATLIGLHNIIDVLAHTLLSQKIHFPLYCGEKKVYNNCTYDGIGGQNR